MSKYSHSDFKCPVFQPSNTFLFLLVFLRKAILKNSNCLVQNLESNRGEEVCPVLKKATAAQESPCYFLIQKKRIAFRLGS